MFNELLYAWPFLSEEEREKVQRLCQARVAKLTTTSQQAQQVARELFDKITARSFQRLRYPYPARVFLLKLLVELGPVAFPFLLRLLSHKQHPRLVRNALVRMGAPIALPLVDHAKNTPELRATLLSVLVDMKDKAQPALSAILELYPFSDSKNKKKILQICGNFPDHYQQLHPILLSGLYEQNAQLREEAVRIFLKLSDYTLITWSEIQSMLMFFNEQALLSKLEQARLEGGWLERITLGESAALVEELGDPHRWRRSLVSKLKNFLVKEVERTLTLLAEPIAETAHLEASLEKIEYILQIPHYGLHCYVENLLADQPIVIAPGNWQRLRSLLCKQPYPSTIWIKLVRQITLTGYSRNEHPSLLQQETRRIWRLLLEQVSPLEDCPLRSSVKLKKCIQEHITPRVSSMQLPQSKENRQQMPDKAQIFSFVKRRLGCQRLQRLAPRHPQLFTQLHHIGFQQREKFVLVCNRSLSLQDFALLAEEFPSLHGGEIVIHFQATEYLALSWEGLLPLLEWSLQHQNILKWVALPTPLLQFFENLNWIDHLLIYPSLDQAIWDSPRWQAYSRHVQTLLSQTPLDKRRLPEEPIPLPPPPPPPAPPTRPSPKTVEGTPPGRGKKQPKEERERAITPPKEEPPAPTSATPVGKIIEDDLMPLEESLLEEEEFAKEPSPSETMMGGAPLEDLESLFDDFDELDEFADEAQEEVAGLVLDEMGEDVDKITPVSIDDEELDMEERRDLTPVEKKKGKTEAKPEKGRKKKAAPSRMRRGAMGDVELLDEPVAQQPLSKSRRRLLPTMPSIEVRKKLQALEQKRQELAQKMRLKIYGRSTQKIPNFEKFLAEEAGEPGILERTLAQSTHLLKAIQATVGLKFVVIINTVDTFLEFFHEYLSSIYRSWKMMKAAKRRWQRRDPLRLYEAMLEDFNVGRLHLSRMFYVGHFRPESISLAPLATSAASQRASQQSFPLHLVLETRNHLFEMKNDLNLVTMKQTTAIVKGSMRDFLVSFIPNPLDIVVMFKDAFIFAFIMRYSRSQLEQMYVDFLFHYRCLFEAIEKQHTQELQDRQEQLQQLRRLLQVLKHEQKLSWNEIPMDNADRPLEQTIDQSRRQLQRWIWLLTNPEHLVYPRKWHRHDLLLEVKKARHLCEIPPAIVLELEKWLRKEIAHSLTKKGIRPDVQEKRKRWAEEKDLQQRQQLQKILHGRLL